MDDLLVRLGLLARVALPFVLFMAWIYLLFHVMMARLVRDPRSPVLWFFGVVTGPLTWPVRAVLPAGSPEPRVRSVALGTYFVLWLLARGGIAWLGGGAPG